MPNEKAPSCRLPARGLYKELKKAVYDYELSSILGQDPSRQPSLDLAQRLIAAIDQLPQETQGRFQPYRLIAEGVLVEYGPPKALDPAKYEHIRAEVLRGMTD